MSGIKRTVASESWTQGRSRSRKVRTGDNPVAVYNKPHACIVDGCCKSFTRLEHLRRHQLNRETSHPFSFSFPACFGLTLSIR